MSEWISICVDNVDDLLNLLPHSRHWKLLSLLLLLSDRDVLLAAELLELELLVLLAVVVLRPLWWLLLRVRLLLWREGR